jgi:phage tail tape-measure protein
MDMAEYNHVVEKDGDVRPDKVESTLNRMDDGRKDEILADFSEFKSYLSKRIEMAENIGLNEEYMAKIAEKVAGYLANHEEPRNREEKLLQELWKVGTNDEQHHLAHMLVRLAESK